MPRKTSKRSRSLPERRRATNQCDYTWGLASQVGRACDRWLLAHGQSVERSTTNWRTDMKDMKYRYLYPATPLPNVPTMRDVGILADGTLHNPNGYPEDVVRASVLAAIEQERDSRSQAAKKAAVTRSIRRKRKIYETVRKLGLGHKFGPRTHCMLCNTEMSDPESIDRGIGSDCWQDVMQAMQEQQRNLTPASE